MNLKGNYISLTDKPILDHNTKEEIEYRIIETDKKILRVERDNQYFDLRPLDSKKFNSFIQQKPKSISYNKVIPAMDTQGIVVTYGIFEVYDIQFLVTDAFGGYTFLDFMNSTQIFRKNNDSVSITDLVSIAKDIAYCIDHYEYVHGYISANTVFINCVDDEWHGAVLTLPKEFYWAREDIPRANLTSFFENIRTYSQGFSYRDPKKDKRYAAIDPKGLTKSTDIYAATLVMIQLLARNTGFHLMEEEGLQKKELERWLGDATLVEKGISLFRQEEQDNPLEYERYKEEREFFQQEFYPRLEQFFTKQSSPSSFYKYCSRLHSKMMKAEDDYRLVQNLLREKRIASLGEIHHFSIFSLEAPCCQQQIAYRSDKSGTSGSCPYCGRKVFFPLTPEKRFCSKCGSTSNVEEEDCSNCGKPCDVYLDTNSIRAFARNVQQQVQQEEQVFSEPEFDALSDAELAYVSEEDLAAVPEPMPLDDEHFDYEEFDEIVEEDYEDMHDGDLDQLVTISLDEEEAESADERDTDDDLIIPSEETTVPKVEKKDPPKKKAPQKTKKTEVDFLSSPKEPKAESPYKEFEKLQNKHGKSHLRNNEKYRQNGFLKFLLIVIGLLIVAITPVSIMLWMQNSSKDSSDTTTNNISTKNEAETLYVFHSVYYEDHVNIEKESPVIRIEMKQQTLASDKPLPVASFLATSKIQSDKIAFRLVSSEGEVRYDGELMASDIRGRAVITLNISKFYLDVVLEVDGANRGIPVVIGSRGAGGKIIDSSVRFSRYIYEVDTFAETLRKCLDSTHDYTKYKQEKDLRRFQIWMDELRAPEADFWRIPFESMKLQMASWSERNDKRRKDIWEKLNSDHQRIEEYLKRVVR